MKPILYLLAIPSVLLVNSLADAQTSTFPDAGNFPNQIDNLRPIQQSGTILDPNTGSRQFFQQGKDKLYFLPEENYEPILQINFSIKDDGEVNQNQPEDQRNIEPMPEPE